MVLDPPACGVKLITVEELVAEVDVTAGQALNAVLEFPPLFDPLPATTAPGCSEPAPSSQGSPELVSFAGAPTPAPLTVVSLPKTPALFAVVLFPKASGSLAGIMPVVFDMSCPVRPPETPVASILASASVWESHTMDVPALLARGRAKQEVPAKHAVTCHWAFTH
jgi:hypothetical protein